MSDQLSLAKLHLYPYERSAHESRAADADAESLQATAPSASGLRLSLRRLGGVSDEHVIAALRRGDERAFEAIYDRYHRPLLAFCRHMLGTREEAEDALQHVLVSAYRQLREGDRRVQLKPWLYAIARNRCLSMLRARRDEWANGPRDEPVVEGLEVAGEVERKEELAEILGDLARLPDDQRAALVLAELGDLSHEEIAVALAVRTDKVKALIFQARESLAGWRQARGADCREIQEQLATLRGSSLRRAPIRRHVALCDPCAAFEHEVARQRAALAVALPAVPTAALKCSVMSAVLSASHGAGAGTAAGTIGGVASGVAGSGIAVNVGGAGATTLTVKALAVVALAVGAGGGGALAVREHHAGHALARPAPAAPVRTTATSESPRTQVPVPAHALPLGSAFVERSSGQERGPQASGGRHHRTAAQRTLLPSGISSQSAPHMHPTKPVHQVQSVPKTHATKPSHPVKSVLNTHPTKPSHPVKSVLNTHPTKPSHPVRSMLKTHPTKPSHPVRSMLKTHPTKPSHPVKSDSVKPAPKTHPPKPTHPDESAPKTSEQPGAVEAPVGQFATPGGAIEPPRKDNVRGHQDEASPGQGGKAVAGHDTGA